MHPVIARELRVATRKHGLLRARFLVAAAASGITALFLLISLAGSKGWSVQLEHFLFFGTLLITIPHAFQRAIGLFTEERSSQNLGLLYLTGMTSFELFATKLFGGLLVGSAQMLAVVPLFSVPFLSGGVSRDLFFATICTLPAILLLMVSIGVLASVLCRDESAAMILGLTIGAILCGATTLPYIVGKQLTGTAPFHEGWLLLSPAFAPYAIGDNLRGITMPAFWANWFITIAWALVCLILAALVLRRTWQDDPEHDLGKWWWRVDQFFRKDAAHREAVRRATLDRNPLEWLTRANHRPVMHGALFLAGVIVLWISGFLAWPRQWASTGNFLLTAFVMISGLGWIALHATASRFSNERRSGSLELLLTTPISPVEIIEGHTAGIAGQFKALRRFTLGCCVVMMVAGLAVRTWTATALISYLLIWTVLLGWCGRRTRASVSAAWLALNTGQTMFAVARASGGGSNAFAYVWILFQLRHVGTLLSSLARFPSGSLAETIIVITGFGIVILYWVANRGSPPPLLYTMIDHFRSIAQQPVPDPHDPRLKGWDWKQPLPSRPHIDPLKV